jgi:hypothetical protein
MASRASDESECVRPVPVTKQRPVSGMIDGRKQTAFGDHLLKALHPAGAVCTGCLFDRVALLDRAERKIEQGRETGYLPKSAIIRIEPPDGARTTALPVLNQQQVVP